MKWDQWGLSMKPEDEDTHPESLLDDPSVVRLQRTLVSLGERLSELFGRVVLGRLEPKEGELETSMGCTIDKTGTVE